MSYPVNVNIDIVHQPELTFPSVTVCNMSPVKRTLWQKYYGSTSDATTISSVSQKRRRKRSVGNQSFVRTCCDFRN
jgi:Amiloride-sensitive sodium channel